MKGKSANCTLKLIAYFRYKWHFERSTCSVTWGSYTGGELFGGSIETTGQTTGTRWRFLSASPLVNPDPTPAF